LHSLWDANSGRQYQRCRWFQLLYARPRFPFSSLIDSSFPFRSLIDVTLSSNCPLSNFTLLYTSCILLILKASSASLHCCSIQLFLSRFSFFLVSPVNQFNCFRSIWTYGESRKRYKIRKAVADVVPD